MRGLVIFSIFLVVAASALAAAQAGVLAWVWIALMNPHKEVYGFVTGLRLNYIIAIVAIIGWAITPGRKTPGQNNAFGAIVVFFIWTSISTIFAYDRSFSYPYWLEFVKTIALLFLVATVLNNKIRLHALILVIFISLGYWGVKGGGFSIISGGKYIVYGPSSSHIADNNHLALALCIILPIGHFLFRHAEHKLMRVAVLGASSLSLISVLLSYSRGAFVALTAMGLFWLASKRQFKAITAALIVGAIVFVLLPDQWFDRMETIGDYEEDRSVQGRFDAWRTSFNIAKTDPLSGAGFTAIEIPEVYFSHNPDSTLGGSKAAHSIYFQVLGDHGFAGLFLYLLAGLIAWRNLQYLAREKELGSQDLWLQDLVLSLKLSLIGFWVGGAFLSMAYYDLYLILIVVTGTLRHMHSTSDNMTTQLSGHKTRNSLPK